MIGPLLLAMSWLLLRLEGQGLEVLGFDQPRRRCGEFVLGFVALGAAATLQQLGISLVAHDPFVISPSLEARALLNASRFTINSVLYEEMLFRGYLLYQAVRWLGPRRAVLLDAAAFGVYHWFSYEVFGNPVAMVFVFLLTGAYGLMWARAFVATGSVAGPIGLHLGWNAVTYLVFSAGPPGAALMVPASGAPRLALDGWPSLVLNIVLPLTVTLAVLGYCRRLERRASARLPAAEAAGSSPF